MARVGTAFLNLGKWLQGEKPGAGSQSGDNAGLNGNWEKIDLAVGTDHNPNGTHKAAVIDGANLKTTVADGVTLEQDGSTKKLKVKDNGVTKLKIGDDIADGVTLIRDPSAKSLKIKEIIAGLFRATGTGKAVDDVTVGVNASGELEVKATALALPHNNTRTNILLSFALAAGDQQNPVFPSIGAIIMTAGWGYPVSRAGCITAIEYVDEAGAKGNNTTTYVASGDASAGRFAAHDTISVRRATAGGVTIFISGAAFIGSPAVVAPDVTKKAFVTVELEFD